MSARPSQPSPAQPSPFNPDAFIPTLPRCPGVYLMYDHGDELIYVGKAKVLRARLRQYFPTQGQAEAQDPRPFVATLPKVLGRIEVITTHTEKEALLLERELIISRSPRHNVALKFGSGHLYLRLDPRAPWPKIEVTRKIKRDGARYFGPYLSGGDMRAMLTVVERTFKLRNCDDRDFKNRARPCMQFQIKRCLGPCVLPVERADYEAEMEGASLFLKGERPALKAQLEERMRSAASTLEFERAARYRDQIAAIDRSLEPQGVIGFRGGASECDVIGAHREGDQVQLALLEVRGGILRRSQPFSFSQQGASTFDLISTFVHLYYAEGVTPPPEVLLPTEEDTDEEGEGAQEERADGLSLLAERLSELRGAKVKLYSPKQGQRVRLLEMAQQNAEQSFFQAERALKAREETLVDTKRLLNLSQLPWRAECFDISLFHGEAPYASQVVFEGGAPRRSAYRVRKIKSVQGTDDFAMMREALTRRLSRGLSEGDLPQLLVIDGGKGQLGVAVAVCEDLGVSGIDVVSLAKSRLKEGNKRSAERVFLPGVRDPITLKPGTRPFRFLTQLRDEAHKTAINAHRKARSKTRLKSPLDEVKGVGPKRRKDLLKAFGSLEGVMQASLLALRAVPNLPEEVAVAIYQACRDAERS